MIDKKEVFEMALDAGFRVFGDKIVAADNGSSGLATQSVEKLIEIAYTRGLAAADANKQGPE